MSMTDRHSGDEYPDHYPNGSHEDPLGNDPDPQFCAAAQLHPQALLLQLQEYSERLHDTELTIIALSTDIDFLIEAISCATNTPVPNSTANSGQRSSGLSSSTSDSSDQSASPF